MNYNNSGEQLNQFRIVNCLKKQKCNSTSRLAKDPFNSQNTSQNYIFPKEANENFFDNFVFKDQLTKSKATVRDIKLIALQKTMKSSEKSFLLGTSQIESQKSQKNVDNKSQMSMLSGIREFQQQALAEKLREKIHKKQLSQNQSNFILSLGSSAQQTPQNLQQRIFRISNVKREQFVHKNEDQYIEEQREKYRIATEKIKQRHRKQNGSWGEKKSIMKEYLTTQQSLSEIQQQKQKLKQTKQNQEEENKEFFINQEDKVQQSMKQSQKRFMTKKQQEILEKNQMMEQNTNQTQKLIEQISFNQSLNKFESLKENLFQKGMEKYQIMKAFNLSRLIDPPFDEQKKELPIDLEVPITTIIKTQQDIFEQNEYKKQINWEASEKLKISCYEKMVKNKSVSQIINENQNQLNLLQNRFAPLEMSPEEIKFFEKLQQEQYIDVKFILKDLPNLVHAKYKNGDYPLHFLIRQNIENFELFKLLLDYNVDLDLFNKSGKKPLEMAKNFKRIKTYEFLEQYIQNREFKKQQQELLQKSLKSSQQRKTKLNFDFEITDQQN